MKMGTAEEINSMKPKRPEPRTHGVHVRVTRADVQHGERDPELDASSAAKPRVVSALGAAPLTAPQEWERALEDPEAISALYSPQYLRQCSGPNERLERIAELKRRIESHAYRIDCDRIAEELLLTGYLSDSPRGRAIPRDRFIQINDSGSHARLAPIGSRRTNPASCAALAADCSDPHHQALTIMP